MGASRSTPDASGKLLGDRRRRRPASWSSSGGGLTEPFKTRMPYWNPEESLEGYLNLALRLSGSAFRVGSAAEPARDSSEVAASSYSAPDTAMSTHTALSEVAELASGHLKAVESAEASSETAVFAHTAHEAPYAAVPAHILREAVDSVCALGTPALRCRLGCPVSDYCFIFACWLLS